MELDKRIIAGKCPFTCLDAEQAKLFIGTTPDFGDKYDVKRFLQTASGRLY